MSGHAVYPMAPDEVPHEVVGRLPDGRQFLLTTRFGPGARDDGEHTLLALLLFDAEGAVLSSDVRSIGRTEELSDDTIWLSLRSALAPLGHFEPTTILIQAVPAALLGEAFRPVTLTCEEDPSLSVTIGGDGFFIPTWPFGRDAT